MTKRYPALMLFVAVFILWLPVSEGAEDTKLPPKVADTNPKDGAQAADPSPGTRADRRTPYSGQEQRDIKALSPEEIQGYLEGKGLGLAKAAELNHYPGPAHVLELAGKLDLTDEQRKKTEKIFSEMQSNAKQLGKQFIEKERELDRLFASGLVNDENLASTLEQIGHLQAGIRQVHLKAHLEQKRVLTEEQLAKYDELRGYSVRGMPPHGGHHHNH